RADAVRAPQIEHPDRAARAELSPQQRGSCLEVAARPLTDRVLEPVHLREVRVRRRRAVDGVEAGLDLVGGVVAGHRLRLADGAGPGPRTARATKPTDTTLPAPLGQLGMEAAMLRGLALNVHPTRQRRHEPLMATFERVARCSEKPRSALEFERRDREPAQASR